MIAFGHRRFAATLAAAVLGLSAEVLAQAAGSPAMLLSSPSARSAGGAPVRDVVVTRERPVAVDLQILNPRSVMAASHIAIELFDGQVVTLVRDRVEERGVGNYTWHGRMPGNDANQVILTVVNGQISGSIRLFDSGARTGVTYQIQSNSNGTTSLRQVNSNAFPPDHPPGADALRAPSQPAPRRATNADNPTSAATTSITAGAAPAGTTTIDVMVLYSNETATAAGTAIGAQIQQAIDTANATYANSGIAVRLRLVHYEQASYSESGNFTTDLDRLTAYGDGYLDNVPALRDRYGADLVSLFVENMQYCGVAWIGPDASNAFSVVNRSCASGNYSFVHELGHNFGALHDPYVDSSTSPYAYGHGMVDTSGGWRTVMAYNNACAAAGTSCTRIPYFSNPDLTYGASAQRLGTAKTSDNARVHNQTAATVANFRVAADGCTYTLSPTGASIGAAATGGSFAVTSASGCAWNSASGASWLSIGAGSDASGSGTLNYSAAANVGPARNGTITVGNQAFTVSQATGCAYTLSPTSVTIGASGGAGSFTLTAAAGCAWSVGSSASWLDVSSATSGTGSATIAWSALANTGAQRSANLTVGGATFVVTESAATLSAVARLSSSAFSFGNLKVGTTSAEKSASLTNSGGDTLTISTLTAGGANPGDFTRSGSCAVNTTLASGQSCSLNFAFTPSATGNRSAQLVVGTSAGTVNLSLSGKGR